MRSQFETILNQKMNRKEFLKNVGAAATAVVGLGVIARALQQPQMASQEQPKPASAGYGSSAYGGSPVGRRV